MINANVTEPGLFCLMHSKPNTEALRFAAKKGFIHKAAKRGDRRTSLRPASPKTKGLGYLWDKE